MLRKIVVLVVVLLAVAGFFFLGFEQYLSVDFLRDQREALVARRDADPVAFAVGYFLFYVTAAALSVPGATILTLAAGALFGLAWGTALVSFASTLGATGAFLVARFLLRDYVQSRFAEKLRAMNEGIARDGTLYLFTIRLIPLFPFVLVNLLAGLTNMRVFTYYWVSQLGMLADTVVYVYAGTQLAEIDSVADMASPALLGRFVLAATLPFLVRSIVRWLQRRRLYRRWNKPPHFDRNLIVIGGGAAGLVTSYIAAAVKARVTLVEGHKMGGDCLNYGCVPSKALIRSARLARQLRDGDRLGLDTATMQMNFAAVMRRVHEVIARIAPNDSAERYGALGVEVVQGHARILDPWTVEISVAGGQPYKLTTRSIVIATGARPSVPSLPGLKEVGYVTSDTLWAEFAKLDVPPARLVVLGGGPLGCELAQAFARLGSTVIQIERGPRLLKREDVEVSAMVQGALEADGVQVKTGHSAIRCERNGSDKVLVVERGGEEIRLCCDAILCAVGRSARLDGFGLEELGIPMQRTVATNEYLETLYPNIFAAGDVAGPYQFTHTASHQAWYAAVNALFGNFWRFKVDYSVIPRTTFVDPEIAHVGLNERDAREQGVACEVTRFELAELDRAITDDVPHGFVKVLTVPDSDRILGVTIVGEHAGDLLAEFVLAMRHGLGLKKILGTIHSYPTLSEANKYAAGAWQRSHAPARLLRWAERFHRWRRR